MEPRPAGLFQTNPQPVAQVAIAVLEQPSSSRMLGNSLGRRNIVLLQGSELNETTRTEEAYPGLQQNATVAHGRQHKRPANVNLSAYFSSSILFSVGGLVSVADSIFVLPVVTITFDPSFNG